MAQNSKLKEGQYISQPFLIAERNLLLTKAGKPYLALNLSDKFGTVASRIWDDAERIAESLAPFRFAEVSGSVERYNNDLQIKVACIKGIDDKDIVIERFLPALESSIIEEYLHKLRGLLGSAQNRFVRTLMFSFLDDPDFVVRYKASPAAINAHHVYVGGLIEHTHNIATLCKALHGTGLYPQVSLDLLLAGAFFHDIGKTQEIACAAGFTYTVAGRLLGHIPQGYELVGQRIREIPDFPEDLAIQVKHLILSHHGELQYGSPQKPQTLEALILHYIDNIDSKMNMALTALRDSMDKPDSFTPYHRLLERMLYKDCYRPI